MTSILGNTNCSLQITASSLQLQLDETAAITLAHGSTSIDCNNYKLINVADAYNPEEVLTKGRADQLYSQGNISISDLNPPTANVSFAGYKITNLGNATTGTDALNRQTADGRYYLNTTTLDSITAPTSSVSLNSQLITNLADPQNATDAVNKQYLDNNFYSNTTTLDNISVATAAVSLNSQKITNLADATTGTDALNRQTADARYIQNSPSGDIDLNGQKIINVAPGTDSGDVLVVQQDMSKKTGLMYATANITSGISFPFIVPFTGFYSPVPYTGVTDAVTNPSDGVLTVAESGTYRCDVNLITQYSLRTDKPVSVLITRYDSSDQVIGIQSINNVTILTNRASALNTKVATCYSQLFTLGANESIKLVLTESDSTLSMIAAGSSVYLQRIE